MPRRPRPSPSLLLTALAAVLACAACRGDMTTSIVLHPDSRADPPLTATIDDDLWGLMLGGRPVPSHPSQILRTGPSTRRLLDILL
jgi:hypothetical protein